MLLARRGSPLGQLLPHVGKVLSPIDKKRMTEPEKERKKEDKGQIKLSALSQRLHLKNEAQIDACINAIDM